MSVPLAVGHREPSNPCSSRFSSFFQEFKNMNVNSEHTKRTEKDLFRNCFSFCLFFPSFTPFSLSSEILCLYFSLSIWLPFLLLLCRNTSTPCVMRLTRLRLPAADTRRKCGGLEKHSCFSVILSYLCRSLPCSVLSPILLHGDETTALYPRGMTRCHVGFSVAWNHKNPLCISENQLALV